MLCDCGQVEAAYVAGICCGAALKVQASGGVPALALVQQLHTVRCNADSCFAAECSTALVKHLLSPCGSM